MRNIYDAVAAFQHLLGIEYRFVIGRKGKLISFVLRFDKAECHHLLGLQYLVDVPRLRGDRRKVFDDLVQRKIDNEKIEQSRYYSQIRERVHFMALLEEMLDSNDTVFKYNARKQPNSKIKAEFLLENCLEERRVFLFLDKGQNEKYYCRSFFPESTRDFAQGQPRYTLLYKEKIDFLTCEHIILFDKLSPRR